MNKVRCAAMGGGKINSLWRSVKIAKNLNCDSIPSNLTCGGVPVPAHQIADAFAAHFNDKIKSHVINTKVCPNVYNGRNKIIVQNRNFMQKNDVKECMQSLKSKKCEGYDRIPVCVITDASDVLLEPMSQLFDKIYSIGVLPEQWKISKIIPIFKKGDKSKIENYRPIANIFIHLNMKGPNKHI